MITELELRDFKGFRSATVNFDRFSLLLGANAAGKSNVREALRFLSGAGQGFTLAEILGEKWADGGRLVWTGLRGGALQAIRHGADSARLRVRFTVPAEAEADEAAFDYGIDFGLVDGVPRVGVEWLWMDGSPLFDTHPNWQPRGLVGDWSVKARVATFAPGNPPDQVLLRDRPLLAQVASGSDTVDRTRRHVSRAADYLASIRFLDLDPESARRSSPRGLTVLGDRGENLSSVLAAICAERGGREVVTSWLRALTPMDAVDIEFDSDLNNRTLALLVESDGQRTPLSAASDGTVRFLAMVASLVGGNNRVALFEEIENGIHPHRVALLLELIEQSVASGRTQVIATSHSPQLLAHALRSGASRPTLLARSSLDGSTSAIDVKGSPELLEVLDGGDPADLMAAGWFEDTAAFMTADEED